MWSELKTKKLKLKHFFFHLENNFNLIGYFKCQNEKKYLNLTEVCDNKIHCQKGDDEYYCDKRWLNCPDGCKCIALNIINCKNLKLKEMDNIYFKIIILNNIFALKLPLKSYFSVLVIKFYSIKINLKNIFKKFPNTFLIDLKNNSIKKLLSLNENITENFILQYLSITNNKELTLNEYSTLKYFPSLIELNLSKTGINFIPLKFFFNLNELKILTIKHCYLNKIDKNSFNYLNNLRIINFKGTELSDNFIIKNNFILLKNLTKIYSESLKLCCLSIKTLKNLIECQPNKSSELNISCKKFLYSNFSEKIIYFLGIFGILGNILSIIFHISYRNDISIIFFINLSISDLFLSLYYFLLIFINLNFDGSYIEYDYQWRNSISCKFLGFLSTFAVIESMKNICFLTIEYYLKFIEIDIRFFIFKYKLYTSIFSSAIFSLLCIIPIFIFDVRKKNG